MDAIQQLNTFVRQFGEPSRLKGMLASISGVEVPVRKWTLPPTEGLTPEAWFEQCEAMGIGFKGRTAILPGTELYSDYENRMARESPQEWAVIVGRKEAIAKARETGGSPEEIARRVRAILGTGGGYSGSSNGTNAPPAPAAGGTPKSFLEALGYTEDSPFVRMLRAHQSRQGSGTAPVSNGIAPTAGGFPVPLAVAPPPPRSPHGPLADKFLATVAALKAENDPGIKGKLVGELKAVRAQCEREGVDLDAATEAATAAAAALAVPVALSAAAPARDRFFNTVARVNAERDPVRKGLLVNDLKAVRAECEAAGVDLRPTASATVAFPVSALHEKYVADAVAALKAERDPVKVGKMVSNLKKLRIAAEEASKALAMAVGLENAVKCMKDASEPETRGKWASIVGALRK